MVRRLTVLFLFASSLGTSGCMLPDYYHPGGYSSTSLQRLEESQVEWEDSKWSLPKFPVRLVAEYEAAEPDEIETAIANDAEPEAAARTASYSDPSRTANRRGRFGRH